MRINKDTIYILIIALLLIIGFLFFGNNLYFPLSDIGREFYIPSEISEGKVLYKDIFNLYAPLGYYINALFVKIFGNSLQVFRILGLVLSFSTIYAIFEITKLFTNRNIALSVSIFTIVSCTFYPSISNWTTPYSYSILYALSAVLWGLYFIIKYTNEGENKYLYISSLLYGLSLSCKYEFALFAFILIISVMYKKTNIINIFKTFFSISVFPVLSILILFHYGVSVIDLTQALYYSASLLNSDYAMYFYSYSGIILNINSIKSILFSFAHPHFVTLFYAIPIINLLILLFSLKSDFKYILLYFSAAVLSFKVLGGINFEIYGTYFFPLLFVCLLVFLYNKKIPQKILIFLCSVLILSYTFFIFSNNTLEEVKTPKGTVKVTSEFKEALLNMTEFMSLINKEDKILLLPEGVFLNYLTDKKTDNYIFYLIPPHSEILTDNFVIKRIKNGNYKYIAISNVIYPWYNEYSYSQGWGKDVFAFIQSKYHLKQVLGKNFKFYVYEIN